MEIIFDRGKAASWGISADPDNSPQKLVDRTERKLRLLGEFVGAEKVEYDGDSIYRLTKQGRTLTISLLSTPTDGAWMNLSVTG
jgi:hypothetical protein